MTGKFAPYVIGLGRPLIFLSGAILSLALTGRYCVGATTSVRRGAAGGRDIASG